MTELKTCPRCGTDVKPEWKYCMICGLRLTAQTYVKVTYVDRDGQMGTKVLSVPAGADPREIAETDIKAIGGTLIMTEVSA